ncbi:MAG TPA: polysaccharide biosynthesis/export family protein [Terracidiphilus sp.]|nr:polysaccharide biosynthesis/export family protein [Terracidiphilus sp.]
MMQHFNKRHPLQLTILALLLIWPAQALVAQDPQQPPQTTDSAAPVSTRPQYVIGSGDVLAINVWKEAELTRTVLVRPDGRISLPLIGEVQAAGRTTDQVQAEILNKLSSFISHPQVNVIVQEIKSRTFNVVGKVIKPGEYDLIRPMNVLDGVALAGGFTEFAKKSKIYVLRKGPDGRTIMLPFNYKKVIKGESLNQNVPLKPGDTIVVP